MKKFSALMLFSILLSACSSSNVESINGSSAPIENTRWVLKTLKDVGNLSGAKEVTLTLRGENKADGNAGCNNYFTTYKLQNQNLSFSDVGATRMYCESAMSVEDNFTKMLKTVTRYQVSGTTLILYKGDVQLATFESVLLN
jgi:heat shock protein HslJ